MDELDHAASGMWSLPLISALAPSREQSNIGAAFPATADDVLGNLVDQDYVGRQSRADQVVDSPHVGGRQGLYIGQVSSAGLDGTGR